LLSVTDRTGGAVEGPPCSRPRPGTRAGASARPGPAAPARPRCAGGADQGVPIRPTRLAVGRPGPERGATGSPGRLARGHQEVQRGPGERGRPSTVPAVPAVRGSARAAACEPARSLPAVPADRDLGVLMERGLQRPEATRLPAPDDDQHASRIARSRVRRTGRDSPGLRGPLRSRRVRPRRRDRGPRIRVGEPRNASGFRGVFRHHRPGRAAPGPLRRGPGAGSLETIPSVSARPR